MSSAPKAALSLLIIDDNASSLELLSSALAQPGLEILTASDPEEGIDLVFNRHPQIVLTDLVMPHLSGLEVLERIVEFDPAIDVILMTAHYSTESAVEAIKRVLNCSAVVETLFESELFGHVKGSFTGAAQDKAGMYEHAHGGTLFLDEIGDMPLATQAKLLRVLQNQEVQRVGSLTARKVDVRVVAATNHDLRTAIAEKRFREDLYYRLSMVEIHVARLAERKEDLPLLERHFISRFATQYGKEIRGLTHRAQILLALHAWPGNVRELENVK